MGTGATSVRIRMGAVGFMIRIWIMRGRGCIGLGVLSAGLKSIKGKSASLGDKDRAQFNSNRSSEKEVGIEILETRVDGENR
jgi:hypothetical protein